jgi:hypothetical protein
MSRTGLATLGFAFCLALPAGAEGLTAGQTVTLAFVGEINLDGLPGDLVRHGDDPFTPSHSLARSRAGGAPPLARRTLWGLPPRQSLPTRHPGFSAA